MRFLTICIALAAGPLAAEPAPCPNGIVAVESADPGLTGRVCRASDDALRAFAQCGLPAPAPLTVRPVDAFEQDCVGLFHCGENLIEILTPDALGDKRADLALFAHMPVDRFFDSILLHEMAHALYDATPCPEGDCVATSEYFAYNLQILNLGDADRAGIEAQIDDTERSHRDHINQFLLMMAPERFALHAWSHLQSRPDTCAYLRKVQDGTILFDRFHP